MCGVGRRAGRADEQSDKWGRCRAEVVRAEEYGEREVRKVTAWRLVVVLYVLVQRVGKRGGW